MNPDRELKDQMAMGEKPDPLKTTLRFLAGAAGFLVAYLAVTTYMDHLKVERIDAALVEAAAQANQMAPMMVDEFTRLDSVEAIPHKTVVYFYTLMGVNRETVDLDQLKKYMRATLEENYKSNPEMRYMYENGVKLTYRYRFEDGTEATELDILPDNS